MRRRDVGNEVLVAISAIAVIAFALAFGIILALSTSTGPQVATRLEDSPTPLGTQSVATEAPVIVTTEELTAEVEITESVTETVAELPSATLDVSSTSENTATDEIATEPATATAPPVMPTSTPTAIIEETVEDTVTESPSLDSDELVAIIQTATAIVVNLTEQPTQGSMSLALDTEVPATLTLTPEPSAIFTDAPTETPTNIPPTSTFTATSTLTPEPSATFTDVPTETPTDVPPTNTFTATLTLTPEPSATFTDVPTETPTDIPPTSTFTVTLTLTLEPSATFTAIPTSTRTPTTVPLPTALLLPDDLPIPTVGDVPANAACTIPQDWVEYRVLRGDTLFEISLRVGSTVGELRDLNCLTNVDNIYAGTVIYVPATLVTPAPTGLMPTLALGTPSTRPVPVGCSTQVLLTAPASGSSVSGVITLMGTATVANFEYYKIEVRPDTVSVYNFYDRYETPVVNGVIGQLNTELFANGLHWVRLTVVDNTGNYPVPCDIPLIFS